MQADSKETLDSVYKECQTRVAVTDTSRTPVEGPIESDRSSILEEDVCSRRNLKRPRLVFVVDAFSVEETSQRARGRINLAAVTNGDKEQLVLYRIKQQVLGVATIAGQKFELVLCKSNCCCFLDDSGVLWSVHLAEEAELERLSLHVALARIQAESPTKTRNAVVVKQDLRLGHGEEVIHAQGHRVLVRLRYSECQVDGFLLKFGTEHRVDGILASTDKDDDSQVLSWTWTEHLTGMRAGGGSRLIAMVGSDPKRLHDGEPCSLAWPDRRLRHGLVLKITVEEIIEQQDEKQFLSSDTRAVQEMVGANQSSSASRGLPVIARASGHDVQKVAILKELKEQNKDLQAMLKQVEETVNKLSETSHCHTHDAIVQEKSFLDSRVTELLSQVEALRLENSELREDARELKDQLGRCSRDSERLTLDRAITSEGLDDEVKKLEAARVVRKALSRVYKRAQKEFHISLVKSFSGFEALRIMARILREVADQLPDQDVASLTSNPVKEQSNDGHASGTHRNSRTVMTERKLDVVLGTPTYL